jgi:hypothetical protein
MIPTFYRNGQAGPEVATEQLSRGTHKFTRDEERFCPRCGGSGRLGCFNHVEAGICFKCHGERSAMRWVATVKHVTYTQERLASLEAAQVKRDAAKKEKAIAKTKAEVEAKRPLLDRLDAIREDVLTLGNRDIAREKESLMADAAIAINTAKQHGEINLAVWVTEKRVAAIEASIARIVEAQAKAAHAPLIAEGRILIEGTIMSTKTVESRFGYRPTYTLKMLVADDAGNKYWGTAPSSIDFPERGVRVRFTATVEPSKDDAHFAFFKRPSGAETVLAGNAAA